MLQNEPGIRHLYISHDELCLPFLRPPPPPPPTPFHAKLKSGYYSCLQRNWKQCLCIGGRTNKVYYGRRADGKYNKFCCSVILLLFNQMLIRIWDVFLQNGINTSAFWTPTAPASCKVLIIISASGTFLILRNCLIRKGQIVVMAKHCGNKRCT